jgi:hypothetical protein
MINWKWSGRNCLWPNEIINSKKVNDDDDDDDYNDNDHNTNDNKIKSINEGHDI